MRTAAQGRNGATRVAADAPSILNDVMGPVMRGPSSSHTAGSFHIGKLAAALLGERPARARVAFDRGGSYGRVYAQQGVDRGFAMGLLGYPLTDPRFRDALTIASAEGLDLSFEVEAIPEADHPNFVRIDLAGASGGGTRLEARSIGGGAVQITSVDGWPVLLAGQVPVALVESSPEVEPEVRRVLNGMPGVRIDSACRDRAVLTAAQCPGGLRDDVAQALSRLPGVERVRVVPPVAYSKRGEVMFDSAADMVAEAERRTVSLGRLGLEYEAALLAVPPAELLAEMVRRFEIMREAVAAGLAPDPPRPQLLAPRAPRIFAAEREGRLPIGGLHTRAAARAMAVMHVNAAMGVVCAAPTGGSAGVLPGVLVSLVEDRGLAVEQAAYALFAASAIGVILAARATFAAEVAGCQVEIGAGSAMGAAAVVDVAGGTAAQAADAAAIAFQNSMGSVCDLVQGMVEIPCHTRNAAGASSAFVCADLVMGGYENPIPLDETIDAVYAVGKMLPSALRCTARGGLAITPSALRLGRPAPGGRLGAVPPPGAGNSNIE